MNNRIKELRKTLKLSGEKFAEKLSVTKSAIYNIEQGTRNVTDRMVLSICREFRVSEDWLRNGNGEMFIDQDGIPFDDFIASLDLSDIDEKFMRAYFSLDKATRKETLKKAIDFVNRLGD